MAALVQIVGANLLQNRLLSSYLQESGGTTCTCRESVEEAVTEQAVEPCQLLLIDCFGMDDGQIVSVLESKAMQRLSGTAAALFNLAAAGAVELIALRYGIRGFFYRDDPVESLAKGVLALLQKEYWVSRKLLVEFLSTPNQISRLPAHYPGLTLRESQLLALLVEGHCNQFIADKLFISIPTVKSHLSSIYRKIHVTTRLQAVRWAEKNSSVA